MKLFPKYVPPKNLTKIKNVPQPGLVDDQFSFKNPVAVAAVKLLSQEKHKTMVKMEQVAIKILMKNKIESSANGKS